MAYPHCDDRMPDVQDTGSPPDAAALLAQAASDFELLRPEDAAGLGL